MDRASTNSGLRSPSRKVRIPRDLSVVSFNNQFESAHAGLTSYQFDMTGMAMQMLTFLLYPRLDRRLRPVKGEGGIVEVGGYIVDRGSMGRAPGKSRAS